MFIYACVDISPNNVTYYQCFNYSSTRRMSQQKLRQPHKYTHDILKNSSHEDSIKIIDKIQHQDDAAEQNEQKPNKTKKIHKERCKLPDKKIIKKKFEPSAIRLRAINQTFHNIQDKSEDRLAEFEYDKQIFDDLLAYNKKSKCKCGKNIKYFCLKCLTKNQQLHFPKIQLPIEVTVIHHTSQKINKSSIAPMLFLSQQLKITNFQGERVKNEANTNLNGNGNGNDNGNGNGNDNDNRTYTLDLPFELSEENLSQTYILFPHKNSQKVSQKISQNIKNLVILDCTWFQTDMIIEQLQKKGLNQYIRLDGYSSLFWRYNHHNDKALCSAQSLVYFLQQFQAGLAQNVKKYDNLMLLYCLNLKIVSDSYAVSGQKQMIDKKSGPKIEQQII